MLLQARSTLKVNAPITVHEQFDSIIRRGLNFLRARQEGKMNTKVKRLSRTSIPGDVLSAAVASCRGVRPKSLAAASATRAILSLVPGMDPSPYASAAQISERRQLGHRILEINRVCESNASASAGAFFYGRVLEFRFCHRISNRN